MPKVSVDAGHTSPVMKRMLTRAEAAKYLGIGESTLSRWAAERRGPQFAKIGDGEKGAVRYAIDALDAFIAARVIKPK